MRSRDETARRGPPALHVGGAAAAALVVIVGAASCTAEPGSQGPAGGEAEPRIDARRTADGGPRSHPTTTPPAGGQACVTDSDCDSGATCLPSLEGPRRCHPYCGSAGCRANEVCLLMADAGGADISAVCLPEAEASFINFACRPCRDSGDCKTSGAEDARCVHFAAGPKVSYGFCSVGCLPSAALPIGYACAPAANGGDVLVPTSGTCPCRFAADFICTRTGKTGAECLGVMSCNGKLAAEPPSACTAREPAAAETACDDIDNNCNDQTDEACATAACHAGTCGDDHKCQASDAKADSCSDDNPCTADACVQGACAHTPTAPGSALDCEDGDACTIGDTCFAGACAPTADANCDDTNACTHDTCDPASGCAHTAANGLKSCEDGDACTIGDVCKQGECRGVPAACDDDNACTNDTCNPKTGCVNHPNDQPCDDSDLCTHEDTCAAGGCAGTPADCGDNNTCTADACSPKTGVCVHTAKKAGSPCDDGSVCTAGEKCHIAGFCQPGAPISCVDGNPCTDAKCDPEAGCVASPIAAASCTDGFYCTAGDSCVNGACQAGQPKTCDDANPCTKDACHEAEGCTHAAAVDGSCDDQDPCTADDICKADGSCGGTKHDGANCGPNK